MRAAVAGVVATEIRAANKVKVVGMDVAQITAATIHILNEIGPQIWPHNNTGHLYGLLLMARAILLMSTAPSTTSTVILPTTSEYSVICDQPNSMAAHQQSPIEFHCCSSTFWHPHDTYEAHKCFIYNVVCST